TAGKFAGVAMTTTIAVLATGGVLFGGVPARAASAAHGLAGVVSADPAWESVQVSGVGKVFGEPDTLTADFAAESSAPTVAAALSGATAAAIKMRNALVGGGIDKIDLQTSNVDITTKTDDKGKITGYTVNQGITATVRNLAKAGALIADAVRAGGDAARLSGVAFTIGDDTGLLAEARRKAFADARAKAELYARESGRPLGRVLRVSESSTGFPAGGEQFRGHAYLAADKAVPIEPGRQQLTATVSVEWALGAVPAK
ncbi:MAG TPA: SIMPL domain-containing protein, partial [Actinoplanes sp.]|nr:SIMPL domain-containing protein [Actinoplanes sp.]